MPTDDRSEMEAARVAGLKARHEQRLENATYTDPMKALRYLLAQYDRVVEVHDHVVMDTPEDRELHDRAVATFREAAEPIRKALASWGATYTAAEVKVLTEAALRLGRKEAGEEIAVAIEDASAQIYYGDRHQLHEAAEVARQYARDAATSGRTDPTGTPSRPQDSQAGSERLPDPGPPHPWLRLNSEPWLRKGDPNG